MKRIFAILLLAAAGAAPASAQQIDSPYRFLDTNQFIGVQGGYTWASEGRIGGGPVAAPSFGASWGIRLSGPFTVGAQLSLLPTTRAVLDTAFVAADSVFPVIGEADIAILTGMANLKFDITGGRTWNRLLPYLLFGAGVAVDVAGDAAAESETPANQRFDFGTSFAGQLGAGIDWFATDRLSLRLEGRNTLWKLDVPEAFLLTQRGRTLPKSEWEQNYVFAAGLYFHF